MALRGRRGLTRPAAYSWWLRNNTGSQDFQWILGEALCASSSIQRTKNLLRGVESLLLARMVLLGVLMKSLTEEHRSLQPVEWLFMQYRSDYPPRAGRGRDDVFLYLTRVIYRLNNSGPSEYITEVSAKTMERLHSICGCNRFVTVVDEGQEHFRVQTSSSGQQRCQAGPPLRRVSTLSFQQHCLIGPRVLTARVPQGRSTDLSTALEGREVLLRQPRHTPLIPSLSCQL